jgi:hypothetical protein
MELGPHKNVEVLEEKDVNGQFMIGCEDCETIFHNRDLEQAKEQLTAVPCDRSQNTRYMRMFFYDR